MLYISTTSAHMMCSGINTENSLPFNFLCTKLCLDSQVQCAGDKSPHILHMYRIRRNFHGWNISWVKFSWLKPPMKIGRHKYFATLTAWWKDGCWVQKKSYVWVGTTFTTTYGMLLLGKRWFAWESRGTLMTGTQWRAVIIHGGKIFVGLIFVVEGTHFNTNFNTTKISACGM